MNTLVDTAPRRERATAYTLAAAVLLHATLVGLATLWPTHPTVPEPAAMVTVPWEQGEPNPLAPESVSPPAPEPASAPVADVAPLPDEPMPALEETDFAALDTPPPPVRREASVRTPRNPAPVNAVRGRGTPAHAPGASVGSGAGSNPGVATGASRAARWSVSAVPAYPSALRQARIQGSGSVRVTTDANGQVTGAAMVRSTGNAALDDNTLRQAKALWSGPANASIVVPVTYQLR